MTNVTVVYWRIVSHSDGAYVIEFWTKDDKSNALRFTSVTHDEEKVRRRVTSITGKERFILSQVKKNKFKFEGSKSD